MSSSSPLSAEKRPVPLLCRLFGHKWEASHMSWRDASGRAIWVYIDHVCKRCWRNEYRLQKPSEVEYL